MTKKLEILRPTLIVNKNRVITNIDNMLAKTRNNPMTFRPHFKTHQSSEIGHWFRQRNIRCITVSSVQMAEYFARDGWDDISIAFPVNILEIDLINQLAQQIHLHLLAESKETVTFLGSHLKYPVSLWIKTDIGYHRTGILWDHIDLLADLINEIRGHEHLNFQGLLTHAGHAYHIRGKNDLKKIYHQSLNKLHYTRTQLKTRGISKILLSYGDTPTCSVMDNFTGLDEIRPGNFIFYDLMQLHIGSCTEEQIATALICPVVAIHSDRQEIVIHGGAVHLSKEYLEDEKGHRSYGAIAYWDGSDWGEIIEDVYVKSLSQEHGIITATPLFIEQLKVGDLLAVIPVHSCLVMNLMREFMVI